MVDLLGEAPLGNRKDIRNAVEAARKAEAWAKSTAHNRAQVLYYCAENLSQRRDEIIRRLKAAVGEKQAAAEVDLGDRAHLLLCGMGGQIRWRRPQSAVSQHRHRHERAHRNGRHHLSPRKRPCSVSCRSSCPLLAVGNTVIAIPSEAYPLITARALPTLRHQRSARRCSQYCDRLYCRNS